MLSRTIKPSFFKTSIKKSSSHPVDALKDHVKIKVAIPQWPDIIFKANLPCLPKNYGSLSNRFTAQTHRDSLKWVASLGLNQKSISEKLEKARFSELMPTTAYDLPRAHLTVLTNFITTFVLLDDVVENFDKLKKQLPNKSGVHAATKNNYIDYALRVFKAIFNQHDQSIKQMEHDAYFSMLFPFSSMLARLHNDLRKHQGHLFYFCDNIERTLAALKIQSSVPLLSEIDYLTNKKLTVGASAALELYFVLSWTTMPQATRQHSLYKEITEKGLNCILAINDIVSFPAELSEQNNENLILIKWHHLNKKQNFHSSENANALIAFHQVVHFYSEQFNDLIKLSSKVSHDVHLNYYYHTMLKFVQDNMNWHLQSKRYHLEEREIKSHEVILRKK